MQHCTPEQLAIAALREPLPSDDTAHLAGCAECRRGLAELQRSVDLLAVPGLATTGAPVPPPASVWASIAAATGVSAVPRPERTAGRGEGSDPVAVPAARPAAADRPATEPAATEPAPSDRTPGDSTPSDRTPSQPPTADVVPLRPRRTRAWLLPVAAAVAGAVVGAGTVAALRGDDDGGAPVAAAALDPLADADASGAARVIEREDGSRVLEVDLEAPELDGAYYEVWLLRPDVSGLVTVGSTQAGTARFPIPAGLDLDQFPVVDVSVEPLDGDPNHSGDSVVRGVLDS